MSQSGVITQLDQVTPVWLTAVLRRSGALAAGAVDSFAVEAGAGNWSANAILHLRYSPAARGSLPQRLFLKMVNTGLGDGECFGPSEVTYYTRHYQDVAGAPLVRCYDAAYSEEQQRYHLLLDDLERLAWVWLPKLQRALTACDDLDCSALW